MNLHFLRPWWLLLSLLSLLILLKPSLTMASSWSKVIDKKLLPHLLKQGFIKAPSRLGRFLWPMFIISLAIAMAGPAWKKVPEQESFKKAPLIIALEVSEHMLARDIGPNRLKRAIFKIEDLLKRYLGAEVSLVAFAGDAHIVVPLSDDHRTILSLAKTLSPDYMPIAGVSAHELAQALKVMAQNNPSARLLIMSSTNFSEGSGAKKALDALELRTILWPLATEAGAPVTGSRVSAMKNDVVESFASDQVVVFSADSQDVDKILARIETKEAVKSDKKMVFDNWYDEGPYFLAFAMAMFLLAMLFDHRAWWFIAMVLILPTGEAKAGVMDWFLRKDQQAELALKKGDAKTAATLFEDDLRKGSAFYKAGLYDDAIKYLSRVKSAEGQYNLGNAYAKHGQYEQAIKAYDQTLALDPKHVDAKANKELVEKLKSEPPKQEQKEQPKDQEQKQEEKDQQEKKEEKQKEQQPKEQEQNKAPKEEKEPPEKSEQKKAEKQQADKKDSPAPEQTPKDKPNKKLDKEAQYHLESLGEENSFYLKRKFLYESQIRKRAAP